MADDAELCPQCYSPVKTAPANMATPVNDSYFVQMLGSETGPCTVFELQMMVRAKQVKANTLISKCAGNWFRAGDLPGLFSNKSWTTALILAIFLPGIDLIYLGYAGLGVLKLPTCG